MKVIPIAVTPEQFNKIRQLEAECMQYDKPFNDAKWLHGISAILNRWGKDWDPEVEYYIVIKWQLT